MYKIEQRDFGFHLTFAETIDAHEMQEWVEESRKTLLDCSKSFGVFVDMRTLQPISKEAQAFMEIGQKLYKQCGMKRSVVILSNDDLCLQFKRIAWITGIYQWERYISTAVTPNWKEVGLNWIIDAIDPDPVVNKGFVDSLLEDVDE